MDLHVRNRNVLVCHPNKCVCPQMAYVLVFKDMFVLFTSCCTKNKQRQIYDVFLMHFAAYGT